MHGSLNQTASNTWKILLVLTIFVGYGLVRYRHAQGDDLGSSYIGCRLIAAGHQDHLYAYDPTNFAAVGDDEPGNPWQEQADEGGFESFLHPYVQTPLWAWSLQPLCTRTQFPAFESIFAGLTMLAFATFLWLVVRFWAPDLYHPATFVYLTLGLWFAEPFRYAMMLLQTHILLILPAVAALILAERRRPVAAGLLLAIAAAVKITPGILILYWLFTRRGKAAASFIAWSAALAGLTLLTTGPHVMAAYLADLHRISRILLLSGNNQSFAAWAMSPFYPRAEVEEFHMLPLPTAVRLGSAALMVAVTACGGWLDRTAASAARPPLGAAMGLVAATVFAPIAWTHYAFILIIPIVLLAQRNLTLRSKAVAAATLCTAALNFYPISPNLDAMKITPPSLVRGQFFAFLLSLAALAAIAWKERIAARPLSLDSPVETQEQQAA